MYIKKSNLILPLKIWLIIFTVDIEYLEKVPVGNYYMHNNSEIIYNNITTHAHTKMHTNYILSILSFSVVWACYLSLALSVWMDHSGGQVSCQMCTCLSSLTLYLELCAGSCVGHMPHSPAPPAHEPTAAEKVPRRWEARGRAFFFFFFLIHLVLIVWSPYKSLSHSVCLLLSLTLFPLTGSFFCILGSQWGFVIQNIHLERC